jgi:hypothetical protein
MFFLLHRIWIFKKRHEHKRKGKYLGREKDHQVEVGKERWGLLISHNKTHLKIYKKVFSK